MLNLSNENNKCLTITGDERNVRKLLLDILLKNYDITFKNDEIIITKTYYHGFFIPWKEMDDFFDKAITDKAYKLLKGILKENNKNISDEAFKVLFFYILVLLNRYKDHERNFSKNLNFQRENFLHLLNIFLEATLSILIIHSMETGCR